MKVEYRPVFFSEYQGRVVTVEDHATGDNVAVVNADEFDAFMEAHKRLLGAAVERNLYPFSNNKTIDLERAIDNARKLEGGEA